MRTVCRQPVAPGAGETVASDDDAGASPLAPIERTLQVVTAMAGGRSAVVRALVDDDAALSLVAGAPGSEVLRAQLGCTSARCGICGLALLSGRTQLGGADCDCAGALAEITGPVGQVVAMPVRRGQKACGTLTLFLTDPMDPGSTMPPGLDELLPALADLIGLALPPALVAGEDMQARLMQERRLLANEVHDSVAQNLTSIRMRTTLLRDAIARADLPRAAACATEIDACIAGVQSSARAIITHFRSEMDAPGLGPALQAAVEELRLASGIEVDLTNLLRDQRLTPYEEQQVFYIAREALTNALKYARADCVAILLVEGDGKIELMVTDNGIGLEGGKALEQGHFGLRIMRERARRLGGTIDFERCALGGTRVRLVLPRGDAVAGAWQ